MDVCLIIKTRLQELGLEQRDLAAAVHVTESYVSQLLNRKKAPPASDRTDLYDRMDAFLKFPKGRLSALVVAQRREEIKKKVADPPAPLFKEFRALIIRKCKPEGRHHVREIFERQAFGELERLVTLKLLDVTKRIARDELGNETWLRNAAELLNQSYEELRARILEFLDTDVFNVSPDHCSGFLDPLIDCWEIDLKTFGMEITLNRRLVATQVMKLRYVEIEADGDAEQPGFRDFLRNADLCGDATEEEIDFLKQLRLKHRRPSALYYYRELQNLRDPLHFSQIPVTPLRKGRDAEGLEKQAQLDSRKSAIQRWTKNKSVPGKQVTNRPPSPRPQRTDSN